MRTPPSNGPTLNPMPHESMPSALAAGSSSGSMSLGMMAWRAGLPIAKNADCTATTA